MMKILRLLVVVSGLGIVAAPLSAQKATTQAEQPGDWCKKCVPPGACTGTESGEWGYTICTGLGGNQCAAGGNRCWWQTGGANVAASELHLASGETVRLTPLAPFVYTAADCEDGALVAVADPTRGLVRADAGMAALQVMTLASR